ncbi:MAG: ABC transporter permease [Actinomycetes bacterium]
MSGSLTTPALTTPALTGAVARPLPRWGGASPTYLAIELRRLLRNRRTMVFTLVMPVVFFLIFGTSGDYATQRVGHGNVVAYIAISMAVYGAMLACTSGAATVSIERAAGWSRQLRLTPLRPAAYIATKLAVAMVLGLLSVVAVLAVGVARGADLSVGRLLTAGLIAWLGSLVFAAFGLFMGYLLPSENVMQILGPVLAILAFAGGLFVPLQDGSLFAQIAQFTPMYGLARLSRAPLTGDGFTLVAVANVVVWAAVFSLGAAWRFRRDTQRV